VPEQSLAAVVRSIRRMGVLLEHVASHFAVMETMTTRDYLAFRDKLSPASGFQSAQLREIEILMGLSDGDRIPLGHEATYMQALKNADGTESPASIRVARRIADHPTLKDAIAEWLFRTPISGSRPGDAGDADAVRAFIDAYTAAQSREVERAKSFAMHDALSEKDRERLTARFAKEVAGARAFMLAEDQPEEARARTSRIRAALVYIESYRELPLLAWPRELIDGIVQLEQSFVVFRQRHARMVERVIGRRTGTGGSAGVDYLDQTALKYRIFHEVWAVRTLLIRADALPPVIRAETYALHVGS
jgi:tryptophan 2,3-dioxygenase